MAVAVAVTASAMKTEQILYKRTSSLESIRFFFVLHVSRVQKFFSYQWGAQLYKIVFTNLFQLSGFHTISIDLATYDSYSI